MVSEQFKTVKKGDKIWTEVTVYWRTLSILALPEDEFVSPEVAREQKDLMIRRLCSFFRVIRRCDQHDAPSLALMFKPEELGNLFIYTPEASVDYHLGRSVNDLNGAI